MCKKSVYYNTYSDGTSDITERIRSCYSGIICPDPTVFEFDRSYDCPRSQAKITQDRDDSASPASCRSVSPASSATSIDNTNERSRRHRRSEVYVNGQKVSSTSSTKTNTMSQPIPIRRSSTMPYAGEPIPERGRRPIIVEPMAPLPQTMHAPRTSPRPAPGSSHYPLGPSPISRTTTSTRPVDVFQHTTAPLASPRRRTPTRDFHDFRSARDARDLRNEFRTDYREYRAEYRSPTRAEPAFSLRHRTSEREPPLTTTAITESSIGRRNSLSTPATHDFLTPHYRSAAAATSPRRARADSSPIGYASAEDAAGREERRRRRRNNRDTFAPSSVPTAPPVFGSIYSPHTHSHSRTGSGLDSGFASSYESSGYTTTSPAGSSFTSPTPSSTASAAVSEVRTSPAAAAVKKNLRWQDDERRRQNEKIDRRPKLSRDETITPANAHAHAKMQGEVKSILKNTTTPSTSPGGRSRSQSRHRDTFNDDARSTTNATIGSSSHIGRRGSFRGDMDGLAGGLSGLNIHGNTPPTSPRVAKPRSSSRSPRTPHHDESEAEKARLRDRFDQKPVLAPFSKPVRSHSIGGTHRRRDIWPRDEYY